jgi:hypothetical protein
MRTRPANITIGAALAVTLAFPITASTNNETNGLHEQAQTEVFVQFGALVTPAPGPGTLEGAVTHFLFPDDLTILKGTTVNFVVNGGGHALAIHRVDKRTTREDIALDLCQGGGDEADRAGRFVVCNGTSVTGVGSIVGTQNLAYPITDGKDHLVIDVPQNVANVEPRVDDPHHSERLLATSGRSRACGPGETAPACDVTAPASNPAGAFVTGSAPPAAPGNRIQVQFNEVGRYLVICMNRAHLLNDHMFGFVNVEGE